MFSWISHVFLFLEPCPLPTNYTLRVACRDSNKQQVPASLLFVLAAVESFAAECGGSNVIPNPHNSALPSFQCPLLFVQYITLFHSTKALLMRNITCYF